jgi:hypothetical protein
VTAPDFPAEDVRPWGENTWGLAFAGARIGRVPLAGVAVTVRDSDDKLVASLTTDAKGNVTLPEADGGGLAIMAATTPVSYAYDGG